MSLIPFDYFPRSVLSNPVDEWFRQPLTSSLSPFGSPFSRLDLFDPFDDLDNMISRNLRWLNRPDYLSALPLVPNVPQKYRISCDCAGFSPDSIKTDLSGGNKLIVSAHEEEKGPGEQTGDFVKREMKRTYDLPPNCESDKMVSFMAGDRLIIEFPLKETDTSKNVDLLPKIVENADKSKSVQMRFSVPEGIDPKKVHVSVKDRDLIVRIEDRVQKPDSSSRFHYYQRTTLPENTQLDQLKCVQDQNMISCTAPLGPETKTSYRNVPIQPKEKVQQITQQQEQVQTAQQQQKTQKKI